MAKERAGRRALLALGLCAGVQTLRPCFSVLSGRPFCGGTSGLRAGWQEPRSRITVYQGPERLDRNAALDVLGFSPSSNPNKQELKKAFKRAVLKTHPDVPGGSADRFAKVRLAFETLTGRVVVVPNQPQGWRPRARSGTDAGMDPNAWRYDEDDLADIWAEVGYNPYQTAADYNEVRDPFPEKKKEAPKKKKKPAEPSEVSPLVQAVPAALVALALLAAFLQPDLPNLLGERASTASKKAEEAVVTAPEAAAPPVRAEGVDNAEYILAMATAQANGQTVVPGGVDATPEMLQSWLALPEQRGLSEFVRGLPRPDPELEEEPPEMGFWRQRGSADRYKYLLNSLRSVLQEPASDPSSTATTKFRSILVVVDGRLIPKLVRSLTLPAGQMEVTQEEGLKAARPAVKLVQPETGQKLAIVGAVPYSVTTYVSEQEKDPLGRALFPLKLFMLRQESDVVLLDLPPAAVKAYKEEMAPFTGTKLDGERILDPSTLKNFEQPPWNRPPGESQVEGGSRLAGPIAFIGQDS